VVQGILRGGLKDSMSQSDIERAWDMLVPISAGMPADYLVKL